jgi:hypothetical protein
MSKIHFKNFVTVLPNLSRLTVIYMLNLGVDVELAKPEKTSQKLRRAHTFWLCFGHHISTEFST